jgi:hypothetical protein
VVGCVLTDVGTGDSYMVMLERRVCTCALYACDCLHWRALKASLELVWPEP